MSICKALPPVFWVTRDRIGGELSADCAVWEERPKQKPCTNKDGERDGDSVWLDAHNDNQDACIGSWTAAEACKEIRNAVPETEHECIRVGPGYAKALA